MKQTDLLPYINRDKLSEAEPFFAGVDVKPKHDSIQTTKVLKELEKHINKVNYDFGHWLDVCLSVVEGREEDYMKLTTELDKEKLNDYSKAFGAISFFFLDGYYDDVLGQYYMLHHHSKINNGYFPTPFNISLFMAEILGVDKNGTVMDPCVGSGSMLLAAKYVVHRKYGWIDSCLFMPKMYGQDIGHIQIRMCKLQLYLSNYLHMITRVSESLKEIAERMKNVS